MAAESVLGVPTVRSALLDDLPHAARRGGACTATGRRCQTAHGIDFCAQAPKMNTSPDELDDEDDEILDDEEFDENAELDEDDEDDEDLDEDEEEDHETWQVVAA